MAKQLAGLSLSLEPSRTVAKASCRLCCPTCSPFNNASNRIFVNNQEAGASLTSTLQTRKLRHGVEKNDPPPGPILNQQGELGFEQATVWLPGQKFNHTPAKAARPTLGLRTHLDPPPPPRLPILQSTDSPLFVFTSPLCVNKEVAINVMTEYYMMKIGFLLWVCLPFLRTLSTGSRKDRSWEPGGAGRRPGG